MIILMDLEHVCGFSLLKYTTLVLGWNQGYPRGIPGTDTLSDNEDGQASWRAALVVRKALRTEVKSSGAPT